MLTFEERIRMIKHFLILTLFAFIVFLLGWGAGEYLHPYEQCKRMYDTPEDIAECVWIKENQ
jgi:hypothetical protein